MMNDMSSHCSLGMACVSNTSSLWGQYPNSDLIKIPDSPAANRIVCEAQIACW